MQVASCGICGTDCEYLKYYLFNSMWNYLFRPPHLPWARSSDREELVATRLPRNPYRVPRNAHPVTRNAQPVTRNAHGSISRF